MSDNNSEQALDTRVKALHAELSQYLQETQRRSKRMGMLLTLLVIVVAGYLTFIYVKLADVNADTASQLAYQRTLDYVNAAPPVLIKALKDKAPEVFDMAEIKMLESPAMVAGYIRQTALAKTQFVLDQSEPRVNQVIIEAVAHAKAATEKAGFDGKDPKQFDALMAKMAEEIRTQLTGELDRINGQYEQQAATLLAYLDKLAAGKDLDDRQQHVRNVIVSFLAVAEKHKTMQ